MAGNALTSSSSSRPFSPAVDARSINLGLAAIAFISPQNHPILVRAVSGSQEDLLKYHYLAHTSLDVIDERIAAASKAPIESYLGFLYALEDVAVYGYITPLKLKIVIILTLSDAVVRDADVISIFKALHWAYYRAAANPLLKLHTPLDTPNDHILVVGSPEWVSFRKRVDEVARAAGALPVDSAS
ncbi:Sedlin [Multifurca ochricompacta]|uniref:Trafficking protein particle complex subunit 2-like protein n=1 Tax=Multifurca ochricompacta TaxID=376703 RepID=A0AAD4QQT0_9AGAM|nr:Sedlin [Multifurca ochricompacta]